MIVLPVQFTPDKDIHFLERCLISYELRLKICTRKTHSQIIFSKKFNEENTKASFKICVSMTVLIEE
jgi:hypothetical protein